MPRSTPDIATPPEPTPRQSSAGDPPGKWLGAGALAVLLLLAASLAIARIGLAGRWNPRMDRPRAPSSFTNLAGNPPLEIDPQAALILRQNREEIELSTYGWTDRQAGLTRVPISRAMDLLLGAGLPVRSPDTPEPMDRSGAKVIPNPPSHE